MSISPLLARGRATKAALEWIEGRREETPLAASQVQAVPGPLLLPTTNVRWRVGGQNGFRGDDPCAVLHVIEVMGPEQLCSG